VLGVAPGLAPPGPPGPAGVPVGVGGVSCANTPTVADSSMLIIATRKNDFLI
jgi:hypothetical protein